MRMLKFLKISLFILPLMGGNFVYSGEVEPPQQGSKIVEDILPVDLAFLPKDYKGLRYHLLVYPVAKKNQKFPMILALHGTGDKGQNYLEVWKEEAEKRQVMVLCPDLDMVDVDTFYRLVEEVGKKYPVDKKKLYLAGVSSGALIARWILLSRPFAWKAAVLIASPGKEPWTSKVDTIRLPPILFVHGGKDPQFDIEEIQKHVDTLKRRGGRVWFFRYPNAGHEHRQEWNPVIFDWIKNQGK